MVDNSAYGLMFIFAVIFIGYGYLLMILRKRNQSMRLEMAVLGEELLKNKFSTPADKKFINTTLDHAYDGWFAAKLALLFFPIMLNRVFRGVSKRQNFAKTREHSKYQVMALYSMFIANPLCVVLLFMQAFVFSLVRKICMAGLRLSWPSSSRAVKQEVTEWSTRQAV